MKREGPKAKAYNPLETEEKLYAYWLSERVFSSRPHPGAAPYTIVIPPPNVTGMLHMGHVLNNTLQDILIRWKRMEGRETLWLPGTDHAGIATQNVVEKALATRGQKREDLGREAFVAEVWRWKEQYGSTIIRQLQRMGCSCDWERERFTLDPGLSRAVEEVFTRLYRKGLIYRGRYIVNWCPRCTSAISDEEVDRTDRQGSLYYVSYPRPEGAGSIDVATTRPETMLGDVAVAVHPEDARYASLVGTQVRLPLTNRTIPIIADPWVDPGFGTGAVKVTPAHDANDFQIGERHGLAPIVAMDETGHMTAVAGRFAGLDRFECRRQVVEALEAEGLLLKVEPHQYAVGSCHRCDSVVEPYLSTQWFVRMAPLAAPAIRVVQEELVRFHPERWTGVYLNWLENIRDWCISRQLWWGHRIPVYYCQGCERIHVGGLAPSRCEACGGASFRRDPDVLDTWFSSWLWPFSTLGWPDDTDDLRYYYPTSTLVTGGDIIFFWVARMIMAGLEFMGKVPFHDVYLHGMVRDAEGQRMSKSRGNSADPLEIMDRVGADALRLYLVHNAAEVEGLRFGEEALELGRNFANKLWNAWRFVSMNLVEGERVVMPPPEARAVHDRWILGRLGETAREVTDALEKFRLGDACRTIYQFTWHDYCDWYIELAKLRLRPGGDSARATRAVLVTVLQGILRLLHPFVPFLTEAIWQEMPGCAGPLARAPWPRPEDYPADPGAARDMESLRETVVCLRSLRTELGMAPGTEAAAALRIAEADVLRALTENSEGVMALARLKELRFLREGEERPHPSASALARGIEVFLVLGETVDLDKEKARLARERDRLEGLLAASERKMSDPQFRERAPRDVVEREIVKQENFRQSRGKVTRLLESLE